MKDLFIIIRVGPFALRKKNNSPAAAPINALGHPPSSPANGHHIYEYSSKVSVRSHTLAEALINTIKAQFIKVRKMPKATDVPDGPTNTKASIGPAEGK